MKFSKLFLLLPVLLLMFGSCAQEPEKTPDGTTSGKSLYIVATTGIIADALKQIVGEDAEVEALMGPGVDPHLYKATQGDLTKLRKADIIFYNGLHLEGKMAEVLEKLGSQKPVIAVGDGISKDQLIQSAENVYDPHIWFDVKLWKQAVKFASEKLAENDINRAETYRKNAKVYLQQLDSLDRWVRNQVHEIPIPQRVMITAHDAFEYFGRAYNIDVKGLQGISTLSEYGLKDITTMVDFIVERQIKAVFVESSVSDKAVRSVIKGAAERGHKVQIGGTLYSDALGAKNSPEGTYTGMVRSNVNTIVQSLK